VNVSLGATEKQLVDEARRVSLTEVLIVGFAERGEMRNRNVGMRLPTSNCTFDF
jgi:hypothetical protein